MDKDCAHIAIRKVMPTPTTCLQLLAQVIRFLKVLVHTQRCVSERNNVN